MVYVRFVSYFDPDNSLAMIAIRFCGGDILLRVYRHISFTLVDISFKRVIRFNTKIVHRACYSERTVA